MKKILAIFLCLCTVLCFAGCKDQESQTSTNPNGQNAAQTAKQRSNVMEYDDEIGSSYYLIGDFENYFECSQVKYSGGKMTQTKKSEHPDLVTYGEQSLQVVVS